MQEVTSRQHFDQSVFENWKGVTSHEERERKKKEEEEKKRINSITL